MFGVASMPYCWAEKSMRKENGAAQRAVECVVPILRVGRERDMRKIVWSGDDCQ